MRPGGAGGGGKGRIKMGKTITLPCEIGDTLYLVSEYEGVVEAKVRCFWIGEVGSNKTRELMIRTTRCDVPVENIGKTAFFCREEAEAARK